MPKPRIGVMVDPMTPPDFAVFDDLYVCSAGHLPQKTGMINTRFNIYALGLVVRGCGRYHTLGNAWQEVVPGTLLTVYPGAHFEYGPGAGQWEEYYVSFSGPNVRRLVGLDLLPTDGLLRRVAETARLVECFEELLVCWQRRDRGDQDRALLLGQRILLEAFWAQRSPPAALADPLRPIMDYCRSHLAEPIDFEQLAERHRVSYSSLRQKLRQRTGLAPAKYLTRLRCDAACRLLSGTTLTAKQIAQRVGIADPYTFSRVFHRQIGLSPRAYRRQAFFYASR